MISDEFDRMTMANMEVALERACQLHPDQFEGHEARRLVAVAILESAQCGRKNLGQLTLAATRAVLRLRPAALSRPESRERRS